MARVTDGPFLIGHIPAGQTTPNYVRTYSVPRLLISMQVNNSITAGVGRSASIITFYFYFVEIFCLAVSLTVTQTWVYIKIDILILNLISSCQAELSERRHDSE
jgi:hypothetical protein